MGLLAFLADFVLILPWLCPDPLGSLLRFSSGFPPVLLRFSSGFPPVFLRFSSNVCMDLLCLDPSSGFPPVFLRFLIPSISPLSPLLAGRPAVLAILQSFPEGAECIRIELPPSKTRKKPAKSSVEAICRRTTGQWFKLTIVHTRYVSLEPLVAAVLQTQDLILETAQPSPKICKPKAFLVWSLLVAQGKLQRFLQLVNHQKVSRIWPNKAQNLQSARARARAADFGPYLARFCSS